MNPRTVLKHPPFRRFITARFLALSSHQMMAVAVSQYLYLKTHNPLALGYIGLSIFLPKFLLTLPAGHMADLLQKQKIIFWCRSLQAVLSFALVGLIHLNLDTPFLIYTLLFLIGAAYTFDGPASHSIVADLVHDEVFTQAVAWNSSIMQIAFVTGPALGGILYGFDHRGLVAFYSFAFLRLISAILVSGLPVVPVKSKGEKINRHTLMAGLVYVKNHPILLGLLTLDLFAVLLGGVVSLLPIFANDILKVGAIGFGFLRAAPSVGAAIVAITLAYYPLKKQAGKKMFLAVAVFGLVTIGFSLSTNFYLSLLFLLILGCADMVSVVIRGVLVQTKTPPQMRGRVSAVNLVFIGASNELGEFESGMTASWWGAVPAALIGGMGTLIVVALWYQLFPEIKKIDSL